MGVYSSISKEKDKKPKKDEKKFKKLVSCKWEMAE